MRVRPKSPVVQRRPTRRHHPPARPAAPPAAPAAQRREEQRARESGGPMDRASYACGCGLVFDAPVSTSVSCPHCGGLQAW